MGKRIVLLVVLTTIASSVLLSCKQDIILPVHEPFYSGFGPAENFVPDVVTIEWEDSIQ